MVEKNRRTLNGAAPLGATPVDGGVHFSVASRQAERLDLVFFERAEDARPSRVIPLDPIKNRSHPYWHIFVPGVRAGQMYAYRAHGPHDPSRGLRFDPQKTLLDPYGRAVAYPKTYDRAAAVIAGDNAGTAMKSVVVDPSVYDWEGDVPLHLSLIHI